RLIAEGVETAEEADTLTSLGVEFGQGYLFGRPEPIEAWVGAGQGRDRGDRGRRIRPSVASEMVRPVHAPVTETSLVAELSRPPQEPVGHLLQVRALALPLRRQGQVARHQ
ncbi:MAG: EAL domain-containing protein, partial [Candidatus Limnocylindrales bacterium]